MAAGVKVTLAAHEAPAANELPQPVCANSVLVLATVIGNATVSRFVIVKVRAALVCPITTEPNAREAGVIVIGVIPVPVRLAVCVPTPSLTVSVPVRAPRAVGLKVMVMTQFRAAATELPQVLVWVKSPLVVMLLTLSAAVPVFVSVTVVVPLELPTATEPNERDVGERVAVWPYAGWMVVAKSTREMKNIQARRIERQEDCVIQPPRAKLGI